MTYLAAIQAIIAQMKPSPPNFIFEKMDQANIKVDALTPTKPVVIYVADVKGKVGGVSRMQESQMFTMFFMYKSEFEHDEMIHNAPLRAKAKELGKQFIKLMIASNNFEPFSDPNFEDIPERIFDANYCGVYFIIDAKMQPGECLSPAWTEVLTATPAAAQGITKLAQTVLYTVGGNTDWAVTSNQSWCVPTPATGFEEGIITATIAANTTTVARTAILTITGVNVGSTLTRTINQAG